jgi:hypothetical protein
MNTKLIDDLLTITRDRLTQEERTLLVIGVQEIMKEAAEPKEVDYDGDQMMSLFEFLGRAAGSDLGKQVADAAVASNAPIGEQHVDTKTYVGPVKLYPYTFLREFFRR